MTGSLFSRKTMRLIGAKGHALDVARGRLVLMSLGFALVFILIAARVVDLTFIQGELQNDVVRESAGATPSAKDAVTRADILDRNGVLLATSLETPSLYADPLLITEPEKVAADLIKILPDLSYGDVLQKLQRRSRFIWLRRNLTPQEQYAVLQLGQPGLSFEDEMRRLYPQGELAAHLVGYTGVDGDGLGGVERSFDRLLQKGDEPLRLTMDVRLQHILRRETVKAMTDFEGKGAAGLIMDVTNGEILAAVSLPDFDPHNPGAASSDSLFNRFSLGVYEPGSTCKIFSTAAALELKGAPMSMTFDAREPLRRGRFRISDYHPEKRVMTIPEVFMYSSNIGSALMGEFVGTEALKNFYKDLGFMEPSPVELGEVGKPLYPQPWREINTLTAAFGHGLAVSPLQVVNAAASIVGDGTQIKPTVVLSQTPQKSQELRLVSPQTAHRMRQLMRLVVTEGTGTKADVPGFRVGGKTGTAEKPGARGYDRKRIISSFLGFFPMEAPRYAVYIMVDEPKGNKASFGYATGGWVAAPAVAKVITGMAAVLGLKPVDVPPEKDMAAGLARFVHHKDESADSGNKQEDHHLASY